MIKVNEIMIQDIPTLEVIKEENQNSVLATGNFLSWLAIQ
jgi:hypothetical protein